MRDLLTAWAYDTIKSDPALFGGDIGNSAIMLRYLNEASDSDLVSGLTIDTMSSAVTVSRVKNQLLLDHKELDCRIRNKSTGARQHLQQEQLFTARELMTPKEAKIVKYLDSHDAWDYTSSRIKKSVRGIDTIDIECVLRNKDKYLETPKAPTNSHLVDSVETNSNAVGHSL